MIGVLCPCFDPDNTWCYTGWPVGFASNVASGKTEGCGLKENTATVFHRIEWVAGEETADIPRRDDFINSSTAYTD
jgi:hypothetical protein